MGSYLLVIEVAILVTLSAVFSGLNIAFMSLPLADLTRKAKFGDQMAKRVLPLRKNSHLTLSAILFGNVAAVASSSILLGGYFNGFIAGLISTLLNVIFGEVLPQAWFSRYALKFCSRFAPLMHLAIIATYPVSKPMQLLLDKILGIDKHSLHSRRELGMIISEHIGSGISELDEDEVEIMRGALTLSEKRVNSIMTPIKDVFWVTPETKIDSAKIDEIQARNYSRIPVFDINLTTCQGVLLMKDLVDIDFNETPYYVHELSLHTCNVIGSMTALDTMFRKFIGAKTHLMPVEKDGVIIGIITIEDLLEEIIGHEIEDESDHQRSS